MNQKQHKAMVTITKNCNLTVDVIEALGVVIAELNKNGEGVKLGRPVGSVSKKNSYKSWTPEEERMLMNPAYSVKQLAKELGRTRPSIHSRRNKLKQLIEQKVNSLM